MWNKARPAGFTLVEILVALAILAIALAAAARTSAISISSSDRLRQHLLAGWVAQNRLAEHAARRDWPETGLTSGETVQGGTPFRWEEQVSATPNTRFRRIEIRIFPAGEIEHETTRLAGYLQAPEGSGR